MKEINKSLIEGQYYLVAVNKIEESSPDAKVSKSIIYFYNFIHKIDKANIQLNFSLSESLIEIYANNDVQSRLITINDSKLISTDFKSGTNVEFPLQKSEIPFCLELFKDGEYYRIDLKTIRYNIVYWGKYGARHDHTKKLEDIVMVENSFPLIGIVADGISSRDGWDSREVIREEFPNFFSSYSKEKTNVTKLLSFLQEKFNRKRSESTKNYGIYYLAFRLNNEEFSYNRLGNIHLYYLLDKNGEKTINKEKIKKYEQEGRKSPLGNETYANPKEKEINSIGVNNLSDLLIMTDGGAEKFDPESIKKHLITEKGLGWFITKINREGSSDDASALRINIKKYPLKTHFIEFNDFKKEEKERSKDITNEIALEINQAKESGDYLTLIESLDKKRKSFPFLWNFITEKIETFNKKNQKLQNLIENINHIRQRKNPDIDQAIELLTSHLKDFPHLNKKLMDLKGKKEQIEKAKNYIKMLEEKELFTGAISYWEKKVGDDLKVWISDDQIKSIQEKGHEFEQIIKNNEENYSTLENRITDLEKYRDSKEYLKKSLNEKISELKSLKETKDVLLYKAVSRMDKEGIKNTLKFLYKWKEKHPNVHIENEIKQLKNNKKEIKGISTKKNELAGKFEYDKLIHFLDRKIENFSKLSVWIKPIKNRVLESKSEFDELKNQYNQYVENGNFPEAHRLIRDIKKGSPQYRDYFIDKKQEIQKLKKIRINISNKLLELTKHNLLDDAKQLLLSEKEKNPKLNKWIDKKKEILNELSYKVKNFEEQIKTLESKKNYAEIKRYLREKKKDQDLQDLCSKRLRKYKFVIPLKQIFSFPSYIYIIALSLLIIIPSLIILPKFFHLEKVEPDELKYTYSVRKEEGNYFIVESYNGQEMEYLDINISLKRFPLDMKKSIEFDLQSLNHPFGNKKNLYNKLYITLHDSVQKMIDQYQGDENNVNQIKTHIWNLLIEANKAWARTDKSEPSPFESEKIKKYFLNNKNGN